MKDNIFSGESARSSILYGVTKAADIVGSTMGTSGSNVLIQCIENPGHFATNDGAIILASIKFNDPLEEIGRKIVLEAVSRANKASGDGSSTTTVLIAAIIEQGVKKIGDVSPMKLKRSLEALIPEIQKILIKQKKEISVDTVATVATISAEDEEIGNRIQEIYQKIGKDGVIHWDVSKTPEDSYTVGSGITISGATYASPYMCDIDEQGRMLNGVRWKKPKILLVKDKIISAREFEAVFVDLFNKGYKEIAIFCSEIEVPVIADLIRTRMVQGLKSVVIKMPVLWRDLWYEDIALATGAKIIEAASGLSLKNANADSAGTVDNLIVTKEDTFIDGISDISKHILALQVEGSDEALQRAERLNTKTARYFVGAYSESALAYRRLKVEDAINAANCALANGIVPGGGVALRTIAEKFSKKKSVAHQILASALTAPFGHIAKNAGIELSDKKLGKSYGYNTKTGKKAHMIKSGIVDPYDVVFNAIKNAIGVAASILTTKSVVILPKDENMEMPPITR